MRATLEELERFYARPEGEWAARRIARALAPIRPRRRQDRVLAIGYPIPYLAGIEGAVERLLIAMPGRQGVRGYPAQGAQRVVMSEEAALPFPDALFDQLLVVHTLEYAEPARTTLREFWRVLAPGGRLILITPNRAGLWTHFEATPFGNGRPFGMRQLSLLLQESLFQPVYWRRVLVLPPWRWLRVMEPLAAFLAPELGGVHVLAAEKRAGPTPLKIPVRRLLKPQLSPGLAT